MPPDHELVLPGDLEGGSVRSSAACRDSPPFRPSTDRARGAGTQDERAVKIRVQMIEALERKSDAILWLMDQSSGGSF